MQRLVPDEVIQTDGLTKRFGNLIAVQALDLRVGRGEIYGFLGPNGAGKTTTIMLLLGLLHPTSGAVRLFGQPVRANDTALKRRIGVMAEHAYLYTHMTAWEYLSFFSDLYDVPRKRERISQLLTLVDLFDRRHSYLREFSRGMQQKISLVRALLHDPELLLLDEPTAGLDPYGIKQVRDILLSEQECGKTILVSSHILSEVERTANRVGVIVGGRLQAQDSIERLIQGMQAETVVEIELYQEVPDLVDQLRALPFVNQVEMNGPKLIVSLSPADEKDYSVELFSAIANGGGVIVHMAAHKRTLEDAFFSIAEGDALNWRGQHESNHA
jgi:ABC-type multidrug transport system ATPase subunit